MEADLFMHNKYFSSSDRFLITPLNHSVIAYVVLNNKTIFFFCLILSSLFDLNVNVTSTFFQLSINIQIEQFLESKFLVYTTFVYNMFMFCPWPMTDTFQKLNAMYIVIYNIYLPTCYWLPTDNLLQFIKFYEILKSISLIQ